MEAMSANSTSTQRFAWGRWMRTAYRWAIAAFAALAGLGLTFPLFFTSRSSVFREAQQPLAA